MKKQIYFLTAFFLATLLFAWNTNATAQTPYIKIIQPNNLNIKWALKTTHLISWKDNFSGTVNIDLQPVTGHSYRLAKGLSGSTHSWYINNAKDEHGHSVSIQAGWYMIVISSSVDSATYNVTSKAFQITSSPANAWIKVLQPNKANIQWALKTKHLISWRDNIPGTVDIYLKKAKNDSTLIAEHLNSSTYPWYINKYKDHTRIDTGSNYQIVVVSTADPTVYKESSHKFKISNTSGNAWIKMIQPNHKNIQWTLKTKHLISWNDNITGTVDIYLKKAKNDSTLIAEHLSGSTYPWYINKYKDQNHSSIVTGSNYQIVVVSTADPTVYKESKYPFTIALSPAHTWVKVIQPNKANIRWALKTKHLISWRDNIPGTVDIYLKKAKNDSTLIAEHLSGSTYPWYINKYKDHTRIDTGSNYQIIVVSTADPTVYKESSHKFKISNTSGNAWIKMIQPNHKNIRWALKTKHLISWNDNITGTVDIYLKKAKNDSTLIAEHLSGSTYPWYINKYKDHTSIDTGSNYQIVVVSTADPTVYKESKYPFTIALSPAHTWVKVLQPNKANIRWAKKTKHLISWNDNVPGTVDIQLVLFTDGSNTATVDKKYLIAQNISGSTYAWYINTGTPLLGTTTPTIPTGDFYRIKVISSVDPTVADSSNNDFEIVLAPTIDVYPNPSTTNVTVKFRDNDNENYTLFLYNRYNMRVMYRQINTAYLKQVKINTFDLPNGIYFLRLTSGKKVISRKIIVQH